MIGIILVHSFKVNRCDGDGLAWLFRVRIGGFASPGKVICEHDYEKVEK
jgi:hypothetical protein